MKNFLQFMFVILTLMIAIKDVVADEGFNSLDFEGKWKLSDKPVWIDIDFVENLGAGKIYRHDEKASAVGQLLLSEITLDVGQSSGLGFIYVPQLGRNHPMKLKLSSPNSIEVKVKVGFIRKTVTLLRVFS